ncbi:GNAT family N-acetyltransferase [Anthocerotibacter panamensis]|uniref:GNAT family N-acetyltransferase n=1 Tax=Anthocerotibacter panamensis TaxID=2857077 RepID=UPI001C406B5B|nr:GNAT family N-acetyltransferase [Anthocerotibacter panamensis]
MIRETRPSDKEALLRIIEDSGQFDLDGLAHVEAALDGYFAEGSEAIWLTADDGEPVGVVYCNPEPVTSGTWNLLLLWTRKDREGQGFGSALVAQIEAALCIRGARLLIVETSGLPEFETARTFYSKCGFSQEARIQNFFADGDDKLIYTKMLTAG